MNFIYTYWPGKCLILNASWTEGGIRVVTVNWDMEYDRDDVDAWERELDQC